MTTGVVSPLRKSSASATEASRLSMPAGRTEASGTPWVRRRNGVPRKSRKRSVGIRTMTGRAMTQWAIFSQRDARAEHAERRRQERQRVEDRRGNDERAADAERAQRGRLEEEQPRQPDRDG